MYVCGHPRNKLVRSVDNVATMWARPCGPDHVGPDTTTRAVIHVTTPHLVHLVTLSGQSVRQPYSPVKLIRR